MPISRSIRQLLQIREMVEDRARLELEQAIVELRAQEAALKHNVVRAREGRRLVAEGVLSANLSDRTAGINEQLSSARQEEHLEQQVDDALKHAEILQLELLAARREHNQVQSLIDSVIARDEQGARRRAQQDLDDWYRDRSIRHNK